MPRLSSSIVSLVMVLMLGVVRAAGGQELAAADGGQGPRFLLVSANRLVPLDVDRTPALARRLELRLEGVTLKRALAEIASRAGLRLAFSDNDVPLERRVHLRAEAITLAAALTDVLLGTGLDVVFGRDGGVSLVKRPPPPPIGSIVGRVTNAQSGDAIEGVEVYLQGTQWRTLTGTDGRYRLADVDTGSYLVTARRIGYTRQSRSVAVVEGQEATADFALQAAVTKLDELVTVTPGGMQAALRAIPTPVTVITAEDIEAQQPQILNDILRQNVPGLYSTKNASTPASTAVSLRGSSTLAGVPQVKIMVDGVETSNFGANPVDPSSIERIEVIRGPQGATLYGADAAGGVIQIFTKRGDPALRRPRLEVQAMTGIAQTPYDGFGGVPRQDLTLSVQGGASDFSYNVGGGYTRLASWLPNGDVSRQSAPSVYAGMRYASGILSADLSARYIINVDGSNLGPQTFETGFAPVTKPLFTQLDFSNATYGVRLGLAPTGWWRNQLTLGVDSRASQSRQLQPRLTTPADTFFSVSGVAQGKLSVGYNAEFEGRLTRNISSALVVGIDHFSQHADVFSTGRALNTRGTITISPPASFSQSIQTVQNTGYFADLQLNLREVLFITGGLRAEENSTFGADLGTVVQPRVGLSTVGQFRGVTVKGRASYGRAIRAPSAGLAFGSVSPTFIILPNPDLAPERQRGWDAGADLELDNGVSLGVTVYDQTAEDLVASVLVSTTPVPTFQAQNLGRVRNRGLEVEARAVFATVQVKAQYAYRTSRVEDLGPNAAASSTYQVGDQLNAMPEHTLGASLSWIPWIGTSITSGLAYVASFRGIDALAQFRCAAAAGPCQPTSRDYIIAYPGYTKLNFGFTQRITPQVDGVLSVDNLTNSMAFEDVNTSPVIGRVSMVGLRARF